MLKRLARWIVRNELEQAHVERAEAVNSAIEWRRRAEELETELARLRLKIGYDA